MENEKIYVESMVNGTVSLMLPGTTIARNLSKKGSKLAFDRQALYEAYYEPGIEYMFTHGILYTDDMAFKKMVGLEDEDAVEPTKTIKLEDNFIKRMVSYMPASDFEKEMEKLSYDQRGMVVDYILRHPNELKLDRTEIIDRMCQVNILKSIELKKAETEE